MLPRWTPTRRAVLQAIGLDGLQVGMLLAGVVVVESIFAWPGLGLYTARAITSVDFPAIAGVTLVMGAVYVIVNALVDLAQVAADRGCVRDDRRGSSEAPELTAFPSGRGGQ